MLYVHLKDAFLCGIIHGVHQKLAYPYHYSDMLLSRQGDHLQLCYRHQPALYPIFPLPHIRFRIGLTNMTSFSFTFGNLSADTSISLGVGIYTWLEGGQYYDQVDRTEYANQLTGIDEATFAFDITSKNYEKQIDLLEVEFMLNNYQGITGAEGCYLKSLTANWSC